MREAALDQEDEKAIEYGSIGRSEYRVNRWKRHSIFMVLSAYNSNNSDGLKYVLDSH